MNLNSFEYLILFEFELKPQFGSLNSSPNSELSWSVWSCWTSLYLQHRSRHRGCLVARMNQMCLLFDRCLRFLRVGPAQSPFLGWTVFEERIVKTFVFRILNLFSLVKAWIVQIDLGEQSLTLRPKIILVIELIMSIEVSCLLIFKAKHSQLVV
jgi:hypothetical protein